MAQFDEIVELLTKFGEEQVQALTDSLRRHDFVSGGQDAAIAGTIRFTISRSGDDIRYELSMADYYRFLNDGRGPGKAPPPDAIREWITTKGINPVERIGAMFAAKGMQAPPSQRKFPAAMKSLTFLISRAIAQKGTIKRFGYQGSGFYDEVVTPDSIKKLGEEILKVTGQALVFEAADELDNIKDVKITG